MLRICFKCNSYYSDESLAFCLTDGTPLVNLDPSSDHWNEGVRITERIKEQVKKHERKMKLRRVLLSTITTIMVVMVVSVITVNGWIYFNPQKEPVESLPVASTESPSPPPTSAVTPAATPTHVSTPTPTTSPTTTPVTTTSTPIPQCSDADERREGKSIIVNFGPGWRRTIEGEPPSFGADLLLPGLGKPTLGRIWYDINFSKNCAVAVVKASYTWSVDTQAKILNFKKTKQFKCEKTGSSWHCP